MRSSLYLLATVSVLAPRVQAQEPAVAITNVTVIPMDTERSMANQTVIVVVAYFVLGWTAGPFVI